MCNFYVKIFGDRFENTQMFLFTVETSRTKLNIDDEEESPLPVRKVIKPDFNLILDNSFEVSDV